ncbi:PepSY domain-containing protein [Bradyrhizobium sp. U87765 SZCCT0131]|uniref:PepSY-associated TM helix domain-containing protein n=1 Tax=unclassified Bradyrhizobium TaxID=2631580 RepID=UPI001BA75524|nr:MULTISPECIES: PepSY-associated TM helix domain-containing protein [unclassified Bradyrhizobium]MBR1221976.1 PepSY domain-containing protein [Bradyrhizobium sp. U87765 SZCCT0131]MBR1263826.1 PepSY domain-containing protein [Bradyrhizobium sp. U87765 SZCCT0134]MBR1302604.1 PepSY domain-containing protein [Bradyrhizobium sp. U87765 SZCCT0110]MBR1320076.1 PepSY domain-containing protein [Bradyrhizobium sp. U87765 SZCCT0109]MBR1348811.1 PepSY domain-containing protein [Bradyrhizobium sp. U87765 
MSSRGHFVKAVLLRIHSVVGLALGLVMAVVGLTGATMAFEDEIVAALNAGLEKVEPREAPALTPDQLIARLPSPYNLDKVSGVTMSSDRAAAVHLRFARSGGGARPSSLYVDPHDGRVLGVPRGEDFFATVRKLHRWLLLSGDGNGYGRTITGTTALCLLAMLITGLVLRWPRRSRSARAWLKPELALRGRGFQRSLHAVVGTWVLPVYFVFTLTGLWYSFEWYKDGAKWLLARPAATAAPMQKKAPRAAAAPEAASPGFDRAWATFLHEQGTHYATAQLTLQAGTVVRVRSWSPDASLESVRDEFRIDAASGRLMVSDIYADKTFGERVLAAVLDIHRGSVLGWPGRLAFMIAAALMPLFVVTGVLLYLSRRRLRRPAPLPQGRLAPGE